MKRKSNARYEYRPPHVVSPALSLGLPMVWAQSRLTRYPGRPALVHSVVEQVDGSNPVVQRVLVSLLLAQHASEGQCPRNIPSRLKLNNNGNSFPLGILAPSTRSSSKKGWTMASIALSLAPGVYSNNFATKSIASGDVRGRNTCH